MSIPIVTPVTLCADLSGVNPVLHATQGEAGSRTFIFNIVQNGRAVDLSAATLTVFYVIKRDGNPVACPCTINKASNSVSCTLPLQACVLAGPQQCVLQLLSDAFDLRIDHLTLDVAAADIDGAVESTTDLSVLTQIAVDATASAAAAASALESAQAILQPQNLLTALKTVDGSGSGLDADTVDGVHAGDLAAKVHGHAVADVNGLDTKLAEKIPYNRKNYAGNPLGVYIGNDSRATGVKITLPAKVTDECMLSFLVTIYGSYNYYKVRFSGYLYAGENTWYRAKAQMEAGDGMLKVVMGKDADGTVYVWVEPKDWMSIHVHDVMNGHMPKDWNDGWGYSFSASLPNRYFEAILYPPVTQTTLAMQPTEMRTAMMLFAQGVPDAQALAIPSLFPAWDGAGVDYTAGARVTHDGGLYKCLTAHASQPDWAPGAAPSLWVRLDSPDDAWPPWRQPQGAHDAYAAGAQVSHAGRHWVSKTDGNVWEPGIYGWTESTTKGDT